MCSLRHLHRANWKEVSKAFNTCLSFLSSDNPSVSVRIPKCGVNTVFRIGPLCLSSINSIVGSACFACLQDHVQITSLFVYQGPNKRLFIEVFVYRTPQIPRSIHVLYPLTSRPHSFTRMELSQNMKYPSIVLLFTLVALFSAHHATATRAPAPRARPMLDAWALRDRMACGKRSVDALDAINQLCGNKNLVRKKKDPSTCASQLKHTGFWS
jgi:hypothetical protein